MPSPSREEPTVRTALTVMATRSDMKGMRAHITYRPAKDYPEQGEIVEVQLRK
jgi:hypothetical protein